MATTELLFITGGVRSGKSAYAEQMAIQMAKSQPESRLVYVATGVAFDEEMRRRIARHQQDRQNATMPWITIEQPTHFPALLEKINLGDIILWDCVTTWLTNEFYDGFDTGLCCWQRPGCIENRIQIMQETILQLHLQGNPMVIVSNEILDEPLANREEVRLYEKTLGELHQWFVKQTTTAIEMEYGLIHQWK